MTETEKNVFNELCHALQADERLAAFQHALHEIVFPGRTHEGAYNMIWAIECSFPIQWIGALTQILQSEATKNILKQGKA